MINRKVKKSSRILQLSFILLFSLLSLSFVFSKPFRITVVSSNPSNDAQFTHITLDAAHGIVSPDVEAWVSIPEYLLPKKFHKNDQVQSLGTSIINFIDTTYKTLDIAAFELSHPAIVQAIIQARSRGVTVRLVSDNEHGPARDSAIYQDLHKLSVLMAFDNRTALMHNKFMISDQKAVLVGSTNFTYNGVHRNNNNLLIFRNPEIAHVFTSEFEEMFIDRSFGIKSNPNNILKDFQLNDRSRVTVLFAPENKIVEHLIDLIERAESHIYFMAFSFTLEPVANALIRAHKRGVTVRGLFESLGSSTLHSRLKVLSDAGIDVRRDTNPSMMHHKVFVVDSSVFSASFNFSQNASRSNDESVIILTNNEVANFYIDEYIRASQ
jgi:phosphatidylserine/phosphatidylglycerophosphate/cardiolipin synthase-like enzyme